MRNKRYLILCSLFVISNLYSYGQAKKTILTRPNILFILVDDLRPILGVYGNSQIISPNMDRLAKRGQYFMQAYDVFPNCGPSRASILSGLYTSRSRWIAWNTSQDKAVPGIISLPMYFRNNGYKTVSLGKVYNNFGDGQGSWNEEWRPPVTTTLWDYQTERSIRIFEERNKTRTKSLVSRNKNNLPRRGPAYEISDVPGIAYEDGRIAMHAIETLQVLRHSLKPFFLAVGFHKPHLPFNAPRRYWKMYDKKEIQLPPNYHKPTNNGPDFYRKLDGELHAYYGIPKQWPLPDSLARRLIHGYYACVSYVDRQVGRVLDALESLGLDKNTIVVLAADHGYSLGEHGRWGKHTNYRGVNHIPLIIKVPGKKGNVQQQGLVESLDIYPTLCDLVGLPKPFHLQGRSFAEKINNPKIPGREAVFWKANLGNGETIMTKKYAYTEFYNDKEELISKMLFDLQKDPHENYNVVEKPKYADILKELGNKLHQHMETRNMIYIK